MNGLKLKVAFQIFLFMIVGLTFSMFLPTFNHYFDPGIALAGDDPGCTNEDCPPDPGCTNEDCPPDPGCTNEDCPPDPGCTNEDCPPDYWDNCCCYEELNEATSRIERICCCRENQDFTCRKSYVISYDPPNHGTIAEMQTSLDFCLDDDQLLCASNSLSCFIGDYWDHLAESCAWWVDLRQWYMPVGIDVKPGSEDNCININDKGVIPVAINGSQDFDVHQINTLTLKLAFLSVRVKGNGLPQCGYDDWNNDGQDDLICHFIDDSSIWLTENDKAVLTGYLLDGTPFQGSDFIRIVP